MSGGKTKEILYDDSWEPEGALLYACDLEECYNQRIFIHVKKNHFI